VTVGAPSYKGFRFPAEIISHCVWLYYRFPLSLREAQEMMLQRGTVVSHETIRQWCTTFGRHCQLVRSDEWWRSFSAWLRRDGRVPLGRFRLR